MITPATLTLEHVADAQKRGLIDESTATRAMLGDDDAVAATCRVFTHEVPGAAPDKADALKAPGVRPSDYDITHAMSGGLWAEACHGSQEGSR